MVQIDSKLITQLEEQKQIICDNWIYQENIKNTLHKLDINPDFFIRHFAMRVINHLIDILKKEKKSNESPIMFIWMQFFKNKQINLDDINTICNSFSFIIKEHLTNRADQVLIADIMQQKLTVVQNFINCDNSKNPFYMVNKCADEEKLKDIRFVSPNDMTASELYEILDDHQLSIIDDLQPIADKLILLLANTIQCDAKESYELLSKITDEYSKIVVHLETLFLFPIILKSFQDLNDFLGSLRVEEFEDKEKKSLLFTFLVEITEDLSKWIETVFVDKVADDIFYANASFSNNALAIETIFNGAQNCTISTNNVMILESDEV